MSQQSSLVGFQKSVLMSTSVCESTNEQIIAHPRSQNASDVLCFVSSLGFPNCTFSPVSNLFFLLKLDHFNFSGFDEPALSVTIAKQYFLVNKFLCMMARYRFPRAFQNKTLKFESASVQQTQRKR